MSPNLLSKLDRLLNNCVGCVFNLRVYDHLSTYRSQIRSLSIRQIWSLGALTTALYLTRIPLPYLK